MKKIIKFALSVFLIFGFTLVSCNNTRNQNTEDSSTSQNNNESSTGNGGSESTHEHTFASSWDYDNTYHWHSSTCGHDIESDKEKHIFKEEVTNPTYASGGYTTYTCSVCGYSYVDDETSQLEHHYSSSWSHDENSHWHACTDQGYEKLRKDLENHSYVSRVTNPTYECGGYTTYTCSVCGYSYIGDETAALPITITWKNYDGTILETDSNVPYGSIPSYDGETPIKESNSLHSYTFIGWTPEVEKAKTNVEYYATFSSSAIGYSITYDLNGGIDNNPTFYSADTGNITLLDPQKNGYEFIGWTGSNGNVPEKNIVIDCKSAINYSFTANWKLLTYTITYHLFEGKNNIKNPSAYTIEDTIALNPATKSFYNFEGWYLDADFENQITSLNGLYGDLNLYARFTPQTFNANFNLSNDDYYTITYTSDERAIDKIVKLHPDESFNIYDYIPTKTGYIFDGWYDENNVCIKGDYKLMQNLKLHPKWILQGTYIDGKSERELFVLDATQIKNCFNSIKGDYNQDFKFYVPNYTNGKGRIIYSASITGLGSNRFSFSSSCTVTDLDTNESVFSGRYSNNSTQQLNESKTKLIEVQPGHYYLMKLTAYTSANIYELHPWDFNSCEVRANGSFTSYFENITSIENNNTINFDSPITSFSPHRDGYDFAGWYDENDELIHDIWDYAIDKSFHAEWTLHEYKIDYDLDGGINNQSNPSSFDCTDNFELLPPSKDGYTFDGWYIDPDFNGKITSIKSGDLYSDITFYAKWIPNTYTATLDCGGGQLCPVVEFYSGNTLIKSVPLFKDKTLNYFVPKPFNPSLVFAGWYTDQEFENRFSFEGTIDSDLKLYAKWVSVENQYVNLGGDVEVAIDGTKEKYFEVVCLEDQTIEIRSSSDLDLYGAIFDENMNLIISNDDISNSKLDFSFTASLKAGHKYYILYRANQANVQGSAVINIGGEQIPDSCIASDYNVVVDKITVTYDESFTLPEPHKEGYEFLGWFDENGNPIDTSAWNYFDNITIYAHWRAI
ncbi:MAG: InlB B-repeat-containing protein [Mollicutes bacterium]|nr:InlB B-repeat-containing protein [Mollicutes bacterium]